MARTMLFLILTMTSCLNVALAVEEVDAAIDDSSRSFTKIKNLTDKVNYAQLRFDSQGKVVSRIYKEGTLTKDTKFAMGKYDEAQKKWLAGEAIDGGINSDLFQTKSTVVRMRITLEDDNVIRQIMVTKANEPLVESGPDYDAILKGVGRRPTFDGFRTVSYAHVELNDQGQVINRFGLTTGIVSSKTVVAMGKYNEKEKKWEAGEDIPEGLLNEMFKDLGEKAVYVRISRRDDRNGIAQILVRQIGDKR